MVEYFEDLGKTASDSNIALRICFSSRHYPYIYIQRGLRLVLEDQTGHRKDLEKYVESRLKTDSGPPVEYIRNRIIQNAAGVFMWVILVVDILNKEFRRGRIFAIQRRLQQIPNKLGDLFRGLLRRDREEMEDLVLCVQWVLYANNPLSPKELYFAVLSGLSSEDLTSYAPDHITDESVARFVVSSSKGLAEVTEHRTVQFIHESVRDFLLKENGIRELWPDDSHIIFPLSHEKLKQCCLTYMRLHGPIIDELLSGPTLDDKIKTRQRNRSSTPNENFVDQMIADKYPFLRYAVENVLYHANLAAQVVPQEQFLLQFTTQKWIQLVNQLEARPHFKYPPNAELLYILARSGCSNLIRTIRLQQPQLPMRGTGLSHPLHAAWRHGSRDAFRALLGLNMCYPNEDDVTRRLWGRPTPGQTVLSWASAKGYLER